MEEQPLNLRRSLRIVKRHRVLVAVAAAVGLALGAGYVMVNPPLYTSSALVVLSSSVRDTRTQVVIARSDPVLAGALGAASTGKSVDRLRAHVQVKSLAYNVISVGAEGTTALQAKRIANAVAGSYVRYLSSGKLPGQSVQARVVQPATDAGTGASQPVRLFTGAALGALLVGVIGAIAALAIGRSDRRLRQRDEIARSSGLPVLASISVGRPANVAGWKKLLEGFEPEGIDASRLRKALEDLDLAGSGAAGSSLTVLSVSNDRKALAVGPRVAVLTASLGIPTALVIGPQQDARATAGLRAACTAPEFGSESKPMANLRVHVTDDDSTTRLSKGELAVVVAVVDARTPQLADPTHTTTTVLGASAGTATAEQLARLAACARADERHVDGVIVVDPDPADPTTGRLTQWAVPARRTGSARMAAPGRRPDRQGRRSVAEEHRVDEHAVGD